MAHKTTFDDALDYIYIANDQSPNTYIISSALITSKSKDFYNEVKDSITNTTRLTAASVTATNNLMGSSNNINSNTINSDSLINGDDMFSGLTVGLGSLLVNDTILNNTLFANGSVLTAENNGTGNVFVIAAIILERNLQNVANYLVASLAVADLFVACLVMPLGAVYEISQGWILGPELCDIWTSCDVLCCTASILHLVAIAVDRYWAVTNIDYIHSRTSRRVFLMIFCVWTAAVIVSLAPQFGWKDPDYLQRIEQQKCMVSQDVAYQVFATCCTFYVPLLVILVLYWKIYQTARKRIHRRRPKPSGVSGNNNKPHLGGEKRRKRLRLRFGRLTNEKANTTTTLGLVEGNSTNTVNTMEVEDTEFSSTNVEHKNRAGNEATTTNLSTTEAPTTSSTQIATVSHLVALAHREQQISSNEAASEMQLQSEIKSINLVENPLGPNSVITASKIHIVEDNGNLSTANGTEKILPTTQPTTSETEVLEDPQVQQQFQQVEQHSVTAQVTAIKLKPLAVPSNLNAATSISALAPQTPTVSTPPAPTSGQESSANVSSQVTPISRPKNPQLLASVTNPVHKVTKRKETLEAKRERKAAKTLAIITGAFVVCWLPFFVMALMLPLCETCQINDSIASLFLWLGYFNSTLNPVIYTIFSPEFRQAFKRILFGGHRPVHYRSGKL
ncbi:5-hydroxytryptamine receptor isoform X2 [Glossina fuscipes]|uniref:5-hydroxytryptamine receptor isoform X2 n=1 Tax=Glossina fuscipes TaxID=7396 RepID=A0A9C5Z747_9MUSC|nr:5-hydroxytryptamine receptor isoform X2 [Glossina fuscipes]